MLIGSPRVLAVTAVIVAYVPTTLAHIALYHPSMFGFNWTNDPHNPTYDNRPVTPLIYRTFKEWWFHGNLGWEPHPQDVLEFEPGKTTAVETVCDKGASSYWNTSWGSTYLQKKGSDENSPCPGQPLARYHTNGINDLGGCALAVAYKSDVNQVQPEDFTVFSVQNTCVWNRWTEFEVPAEMPPCPIDPRTGKSMCLCAWFWVHRPDSGAEENYMTGFQCDFKGATGTRPLAKSQPPRLCGADTEYKTESIPSNCTYGAKQPIYWYQQERNNVYVWGPMAPLYQPLYNFYTGAQNDIFVNSTAGDSQPPNHGSSGGSSSIPPVGTLPATSSALAVKPSSSVVQPILSASEVQRISTKIVSTPSTTKPAANFQQTESSVVATSSSSHHKHHHKHKAHSTSASSNAQSTSVSKNATGGASGGRHRSPKAQCKSKAQPQPLKRSESLLANARSRHHAQRAAHQPGHANAPDML